MFIPTNETISTLQNNVTCETVFPSFSSNVISYLCSVTHNDTSLSSFHSICCTKPLPKTKEGNLGLTKFAREMCHTPNMTEEMRGEFCNRINEVEMSFTSEPFSITPTTYALMSLLTPIGILANLLIIFTVLKCKRLRSTTGYFICNLAIADLLYIICMICYLITDSQIELRTNASALMMFSSFDVLIGSASLLHVTAASVERAIAVAKPMVYPLILCKGRAKKVICFIWVYCVLLFVASGLRVAIKSVLYHTVVFFIAVTFSFIIPCILVLLSYINISIKALKNLQMERKITRSLTVVSIFDGGSNNNEQRKTSKHHHHQKELKLALNLTVMTFPFVFGWGYFMIGNIYEEVNHTDLEGLKNWFLNMLPFLISCINPITYLLFTKTLRKEAIKLAFKPFSKFRSLHKRRFSSTSTSLIFSSARSSTRSSDCSEMRML